MFSCFGSGGQADHHDTELIVKQSSSPLADGKQRQKEERMGFQNPLQGHASDLPPGPPPKGSATSHSITGRLSNPSTPGV
jgi:hypothetical protein